MDHGAIEGARPMTSLLAAERNSVGVVADRRTGSADAGLDRYIALIEPQTFMRECMHRGMQAALSLPVVALSTLAELESQFSASVALAFLCLTAPRPAECANAIKLLSALDPSI